MEFLGVQIKYFSVFRMQRTTTKYNSIAAIEYFLAHFTKENAAPVAQLVGARDSGGSNPTEFFLNPRFKSRQ